MNSLFGTVRVVSEDSLYFYLGKLLFFYITIPLTLMWILIAYIFGIGNDVIVQISAPAYFLIAFFGISVFKSLYLVAIGLGSTRTQFLKVFCGVGIVGVVLSMLFVNILYFILKTVFLQRDIAINIQHPGLILVDEYHFFTYFWIDPMFGLFLLGVPSLLYSINFRLGFRKSIIVLMFLSFVGMFLYFCGYLNNSIEWLLGLNFEALRITLIHLLGLCGIGALFLTYPIMRNASLKPTSGKE